MARTVLVTGAAGFIGAALSQRLLQRGDRVVGLDNLNDYYDPSLKQARLRQIEALALAGAWRFERLALEDGDALMALFAEEKTSVHLKYILIYSLNVMRLPQWICSALRIWPISVVEEAVLPYISSAIFSEILQRSPNVILLSL